MMNSLTSLTSTDFLFDSLHHTILERDEEQVLIKAAKKGDQKATELLLAHNERLIYKIAVYYFRSGVCGDSELVDLQQLGRMGFIHAIEKYNPASGHKLSTYATWWVRQSVIRYGIAAGNKMRLSYKANEQRSKLITGRALLESQLGRDVSTSELADFCNMELVLVEALLSVSYKSFDDPGDGDDTNLAEKLADPELNTEDTAMDSALFKKILEEIGELNPTWKTVMAHRFELWGAPYLSYMGLARKLGITKQRVNQIEVAALALLKKRLNSSDAQRLTK